MWIVYYGDGTAISNTDCTPWSLTKRADVQVIIQPDDDYVWFTQCGSDYYVWDARYEETPRWYGVDWFGLCDYLLQPGHKAILFGRTISHEAYRDVIAKAQARMKELTGYYKETWRRSERRP